MSASKANPIDVREARLGDLELLVGFNQKMALETEGKRLDVPLLEAGVRAALADSRRGRYFMASRAGQTVGSLMLTTEWSDWRNGWFWWIQSVYVEASQRRTGVYKQLYGAVLERAKGEEGVAGVRLYVDADNTTAQSVYRALGMSQTHYLMYELDFVEESGLPG